MTPIKTIKPQTLMNSGLNNIFTIHQLSYLLNKINSTRRFTSFPALVEFSAIG